MVSRRKKLIIVYGDGMDKYANYLMQLISSKDDVEDTVGIPDGSVEATIWGEKDYESSVHSLSSSTFVLFVGVGPVATRARANMEWRYGELGMHFGWLGTQACMYVDDSLNRENYGEFVRKCKEYGQSFNGGIGLLEGYQVDSEPVVLADEDVLVERVDEQGESDKRNEERHDTASEKWRAIVDEESDAVHGRDEEDAPSAEIVPVANPMAIVGAIKTPFRAIAGAFDRVGANIGALVSSGESRDRQYTLLTRIVYLEWLPEFMGV